MEQLRHRQLVVLGIAASLAVIIPAIGIIDIEDIAQSAPRVSARPADRYWFLVSSAFYELHKTAPSLDSMFSGPNTYMRDGSPLIKGLWHGKIFTEYKQYPAFFDDARESRIDPATTLVMYDPEPGGKTPGIEMRDPGGYARRFALLAHQHGWLTMMSPSCRLLRKMPGPRIDIDSVFDSCGTGIEAVIAPYADILDLQAQSMETDTAAYVRHIADWAGRARDANPRIKLLAQLSTARVWSAAPDDLVRDALSVVPYVDGYWIDIESREPASVADAAVFFQRFRDSGH